MTAKQSFLSVGLVLAVLLIAGCSAHRSGLPRWVERPPDDAHYLYAVGIRTGAATMEQARQGAIEQGIGELVRRFGVTSETSYEELRTEVETRVRDEIQSASRQIRIEGAVIREMQVRRRDRGFDAFVLLRYPRFRAEKESARLRSQEAAALHAMHQALRRGDAARQGGDVAAALAAYAEAMREADSSAAGTALRSQARQRLAELTARLRIEFVPDQGQDVRGPGSVPDPVRVRVWLGDAPASAFPVRFDIANGSAEVSPETTLTDRDGVAAVTLRRVRAGAGGLVVRARPDFGVIADGYAGDNQADLFALVQAELRLWPDPAGLPIRVLVVTEGETIGRPRHRSLLAIELARRLHEAGFRVVAEDNLDHGNALSIPPQLADVVIAGWCETRRGTGNLGWTTSVLADAGARAIAVESGDVIAIYQVYGQLGFGEREELAQAEAIKAAAAKLADEIAAQLGDRFQQAARGQR